MDSPSPQLGRPSQLDILLQWTIFFTDPLISLPHLRQKALKGQVEAQGLRSLHWRYSFALLPSPAAPSSSSLSSYTLVLERARSEYSDLRDRFLRSPDGGWVNDSEGGNASPRDDRGEGKGKSGVGVQVNNPLSLESGNPWKAWFEDLELRRTIRQDVQRTFPDIDYFRLPETESRMTDLLFIWSKLNTEIGYRQGMHELLAPLLRAIDYDSLARTSTSSDSLAHLVLSAEDVEADTWSMFAALMKSAKVLYDHIPSVSLPVDRSAMSSTTSLTLSHSANHGQGANGGGGATVLVQPIVGTSIRLHDTLLKTIDRDLWAKMEALKVEPQLYAIRWLRLIFGREFPISDTLLLWDGIFAEDPSLRIIEFISIAMLLRIRDALLASDYSGFLHLLLRYPAPDDGDHRVSLLLQQAISLRDSVSALTGAQCRAKNIALGAAAGLASGDDDDSWRRSGTPTSSKQEGASAASLLADGGGFVGDLAKGVYGRAEALGINKALFGTFNEIRRNVNGQQAPISERLSRIDRSGTPSSRDYMAEIARLKSANLAMGKAVERCVNVLERQWSIGESSELRQGEGEALMAMTGLKHVSDVLRGVATIFDPNVLDSLSAPTVRPSIDVETVLPLPPADVAPTPATTSVKPTPLPTSPIAPPSRVASPAQPRGHVRALSTEPSRMHGSPVAAPPPPGVATSSPTFLPRLPPSISFPTSSTPATPRSRDSSPAAKGGAGGGFPTTQFTTRPAPSATRARRVGRTEVVDPLGAGLL